MAAPDCAKVGPLNKLAESRIDRISYNQIFDCYVCGKDLDNFWLSFGAEEFTLWAA